MRRFVSSIVLGFALVVQPGAAENFSLNRIQIAEIEKAVKRKLKDPDSAKFNSIRAYPKENQMYTVCGFVNAKNSYGGYGGDMPFVTTLAMSKHIKTGKLVPFALHVSIGANDFEARWILKQCLEGGVNLM